MTKKIGPLHIFMLVLMLISAQSAQAQRSEIKRYTNLPAIYIETFNYQSITSKEDYIYANLWYVDETDKVTRYDSLQIRGRGNSTWLLAKKPYRIKFKEKERFLGSNRANAKSWTLLANAGDKSLIRNAVTSAMSEFMGMHFSPAYKFVDLNLNGEYLGNYQISDQMEVRKGRVNIPEQDYPLTASSDISGSYLLEVDGFEEGNCFKTPIKQVPVRIHYPDDDEIDVSQTQYISNYVNNFENVLYSNDFAHKTKGYRCMVDSVSLANWIIGTEVSANIDGFFSIYFYKKPQDPRLYWGPMWDYDIAYDNDIRKPYNDYKMMADIGYGNAREWIVRMWEDPWFGKIVENRYNQLIEQGLVEHMIETIDSLTSLLDQSQKLNYEKWGIGTKMYNEIVLYSSYDNYINDLKDFIYTHCDFLQDEFAKRRLPEPEIFSPSNHYYNIINKGCNKAIDIYYTSTPTAGNNVCIWQPTDSRLSQQWKIESVGDYYHITNREGNLALTDPTKGMTGPSVNTGTTLTVAVADPLDDSQLWTIETQANGYYNLINKHTEHTANLNAGLSDDGNNIISYTTDNRNATSINRLWRFEKRDEISSIGKIGIDEPEDYALAYNPQQQILHFGSETPEMLTFNVYVYNTSGMLVKTFSAHDECPVSDIANGMYVVTWKFGNITRSAKFIKR